MPLLVRHPAPYPTESLLGYVLRVSESNGYISPWSVYSLAGMKSHEMRASRVRLEKLAVITNWPQQKLDAIAYSAPAGRPRWSRLLGHPVLPQDLNLTYPRICPQCVREKGIIEAHWDLALMVACPIHTCLALSTCPKCGDALKRFRPGLLECKCGGNLLEGEPHSITDAEASLLDVIRRKVLALPAGEENPAGLPQDQLMAMNLRSLLAVVRTLGKHRLIADGNPGDSSEKRVVSAAAQVLMDWPRNFIALFTDLGRSLPATPASGVGRQFAGIYTSLFKSEAIKPREQTDFLKVAFLDFAMNHWGRGIVDHKLMKQLGASVSKRYLTQTEFAAQIGVEQSTAARLLKGRAVASIRVQSGKSERILVDTSLSTIPRTWPGKIFRNRDAARHLGLPVSVLQAVKRDRLYEVNHLLPTRAGFHELDLEAFRQKLVALAPYQFPSPGSGQEGFTLRGIMRGQHDPLATKVSVLRAVLSGEIPVVANVDGTPGGLELDGPVYQQFIQAARIRAAGNTVTLANVARALGCDSRTVPGLVRLALLQGTATPGGLRVTAESVHAFMERYVSLASIAKEDGTSSRALMQRCRDKDIRLLFVPTTRRGGPQPFIPVADRDGLGLSSVEADRTRLAAPSNSTQPSTARELAAVS